MAATLSQQPGARFRSHSFNIEFGGYFDPQSDTYDFLTEDIKQHADFIPEGSSNYTGESLLEGYERGRGMSFDIFFDAPPSGRKASWAFAEEEHENTRNLGPTLKRQRLNSFSGILPVFGGPADFLFPAPGQMPNAIPQNNPVEARPVVKMESICAPIAPPAAPIVPAAKPLVPDTTNMRITRQRSGAKPKVRAPIDESEESDDDEEEEYRSAGKSKHSGKGGGATESSSFCVGRGKNHLLIKKGSSFALSPSLVKLDPLPVIPDDGVLRVGSYTLEERAYRIGRFLAKRERRVWRKKIKYDCRKKLADSRPRLKGRFVTQQEVDASVEGVVIPPSFVHPSAALMAKGAKGAKGKKKAAYAYPVVTMAAAAPAPAVDDITLSPR